MTKESTLLLALAGLLHDIGKFMLRAGQGNDQIWDDAAKRDFGYRHAMLTASFVDSYVPDVWRIALKNLAGNHHNPRSREDIIVSLADILAAAERNDGTEDENPRIVHPRQLLSVFAILHADGKSMEEKDRRYLPLSPLTLEREALFPAPQLDQQAVWDAYERLWEKFSLQMGQLKQVHSRNGDLTTYLESVRFAMYTYLWAVPSAYNGDLPDISLFEHGRITAALAGLLDRADMDIDRLRVCRKEAENTHEPIALLIGGDISGVQEFIYTITARGATPTLRGRSFYLQMLTETVTRYILQRLELPITNVIYAGGGNFYILARPGDDERLTTIQQEISRVLLQHHRGDLYVAIGGTRLEGRDFFGPAISAKWGEVHEHLRTRKARRFAEIGDSNC